MHKKLIDPDHYHGWHKKRNFFEGWYFKLVDASAKYTFVLIPGIHFGKENKHSHSFIQVLKGKAVKYSYLRFPIHTFFTSNNPFYISIKNNYFSLEQIKINIFNPEIKIRGTINFKNILKWPDTLLNPGSMGFYNYIPSMQCYAQVCVMDMDLEGRLNIDGKEIDFSHGKGYVEKNWGKAFPYSWIWIQSNNFSHTKTSLSCSLAHIPFSFSSFRGFLIGLYVDGIFYSFTTINRSRIKILQKESDVSLQVENRRYVLNILTQTRFENFMLLNGPRNGKMVPLVQENLQGEVQVSLQDKKDHKIIFRGMGICSGIEYGGNQMMVLDQKERKN